MMRNDILGITQRREEEVVREIKAKKSGGSTRPRNIQKENLARFSQG